MKLERINFYLEIIDYFYSGSNWRIDVIIPEINNRVRAIHTRNTLLPVLVLAKLVEMRKIERIILSKCNQACLLLLGPRTQEDDLDVITTEMDDLKMKTVRLRMELLRILEDPNAPR